MSELLKPPGLDLHSSFFPVPPICFSLIIIAMFTVPYLMAMIIATTGIIRIGRGRDKGADNTLHFQERSKEILAIITGDDEYDQSYIFWQA